MHQLFKHIWFGCALGAAILISLTLLNGCASQSNTNIAMASSRQGVPGGNAKLGEEAILQYGCGSCHVIPGVAGANGLVGPPLTGIADRAYIAGVLSNRPANMMIWIMNPQVVVPGNAMPILGVSQDEARDITTYLYTLHQP